MSRRPGYDAPDPIDVDWRDCHHDWRPVSMVFETQLLDPEGRVLIRQPDAAAGRVYIVCMGCASHTYMETRFIYRLHGAPDQDADRLKREEAPAP